MNNLKGTIIFYKITLNAAISTGEWLECAYAEYSEEFSFRLRAISFEKLYSSSILDKQLYLNLDDGMLWLLRIEVINTNKTPLDPKIITQGVVLIDHEDCMFNALGRDQLTMHHELSKSSGVYRFAGYPNPPLSPKIKAVGSLVFLLPDDDQAEYFFHSKKKLKG